MTKQRVAVFTIGIPGSGKSTWARAYLQAVAVDYPNAALAEINRDNIREDVLTEKVPNRGLNL